MKLDHTLQELNALFLQQDIAQIEPFLLSRLELASQGRDLAARLTLLNELANFYRNTIRFKESISMAQRALSLIEDMGYSNSMPYASALMSLAATYAADTQYSRALELYAQVGTIYAAQHLAEGALQQELAQKISATRQSAALAQH